MNRIVFLLLIFFAACKPATDDKKIIGKWQSDDVWYEYKTDSTYSSGRSIITMVKGFKYSIDIEKKELNMYTDEPTQTYYLQYQFTGDDTLLLNNVLNNKPNFATFVRVKK